MMESFVVEWPVVGEEPKPVNAVVAVRMWGRQAGLYRVKRVGRGSMLLSHGAISFPVGTRLDIEQLQGDMPCERLTARVVANDPSGLSLVWSDNRQAA